MWLGCFFLSFMQASLILAIEEGRRHVVTTYMMPHTPYLLHGGITQEIRIYF